MVVIERHLCQCCENLNRVCPLSLCSKDKRMMRLRHGERDGCLAGREVFGSSVGTLGQKSIENLIMSGAIFAGPQKRKMSKA